MNYHVPELELEHTLIRSHYSALSAHRECEAKWYYRYVLKIKQPDFGPKPEMHFGSWWGALVAAEGLERGRALGSIMGEPTRIQGPNDSPEFSSLTVTVDMVLEAADQWWLTRDEETKEEWIARLGQGLPERLRNLFESWLIKYAAQRKNEIPLGYEVFWKRKLPRPKGDLEWLGPEGDVLEDIELIGYIDEVFYDVVRGIVVIRDSKSHKVLKTHTAVDDMMDSQLQLYAWGATPLIKSWGRGEPRAVAYDRVRSVAPKSPDLTKTAGSLSKGVTDYDATTYEKWANTDTRPLEAIDAWLVEVGNDPDTKFTPEQVEYVESLQPGQFWSAAKAEESPIQFLISGARKGLPKFGVYTIEPAVVERLSSEASMSIWFQRTRKPINRNVVIGHLRSAIDTATDAWRTKRRAAVTGGDAPRSLGRACERCDYASICRARLMGGPRGDYDLLEHGLVGPEGRNMLIDGKLEVAQSSFAVSEDLEDVEQG